MAYDPTKPVNGAPIVSAELRNQFAGLKDLLDAPPTVADVEATVQSETAGNCSAVNDLILTVSNPPTQAEVQQIADKLLELLVALKRA